MRRRRGVGRALALALIGVVLGVGSSPAQEAGAGEIERLREAARHEAAGELDRAESLLRDVVEERPESLPALLSLERVLRRSGRLEDLVPLVEAGLAREPSSPLLNQLRVRSLSELDRVAELEAAATDWLGAVPGLEVPYREIGRVWRARGEYARAREVLEEGRRRLQRPDALALELGDLYAEIGEPRLAVREWDRAIDRRGRGATQVRRRLRSLPDAGGAVLPDLLDLLAREPAPRGRLEAAVELALEGGLEDRTWSLVERLLPELAVTERRALMEEIGRKADAAGLARLAYRAYGELVAIEEAAGRRGRGTVAGGAASPANMRLLVIRDRVAELALVVGDTAGAARSYRAVEEAFEPGSPGRRRAMADRIELLAARDPGQALDALNAFIVEHPEAPEVDGLSAAIARALERDGRRGEAERVLSGVDGPRSSLVRGRLLLARGEIAGARAEYVRAAPGLEGREATRVLTLATLLGRIPATSGPVVGDALRLRDRGDAGAAVDRILAGVAAVEPDGRAPLLDFAAGVAVESGLMEEARTIRRRIVTDHPGAAEAPRALLALARDLGSEVDARAEARELLERLIIEYPRSALVPQARRELDRLTRGGPA